MTDPRAGSSRPASRSTPPAGPADFEGRLLVALTAADGAAPRERGVARGSRRSARVRLAALAGAALVMAGAGGVLGAIYLAPPTFQPAGEAAVAGDTLIFKGSGCRPGASVGLSLDGGPRLTSATAAADGTFAVEAGLPAGMAEGAHQAAAACPDGRGEELVQRASFTILASRPPLGEGFEVAGAAEPDGLALVKGAGCRAGSAVTFVLDERFALGGTAADSEGGFVGNLTVPSATALGTHQLRATCEGSAGSALVQTAALEVVAHQPVAPASKGP